jgi:hypothetical protein
MCVETQEPQARGKWLTASVADDIPAVIAAAFEEAQRRDPEHRRKSGPRHSGMKSGWWRDELGLEPGP